MSIYLQGKKAELVSIQAGHESVVEVWAGDVMVWPDVTDSAGGIIIEPPSNSSEDYRYWLHALDAVDTLTVDNNCYLKFEVEGVEYYINRAPRGAERVVLEGNIIKLDKKQQSALVGKVGETIIAKAKIPEREGGWRKFKNINSTSHRIDASWALPLLEGSYFKISAYKGQKREHAYNKVYYTTSEPSGTVFDIDYSSTVGGEGRYNYTRKTSPLTGVELVNSDYITTVTYNVYGSTGCRKGISAIWPAFEREFELTVLSVY